MSRRRLEIMKALTEVLKGITPANGYTFDLSDEPVSEGGRPRVCRGRIHLGDDEPLPMIAIVEPPASVEQLPTKRQPDNRSRNGEWDLIVQGWAKDDKWNPTDIAYVMAGEVCHRLAHSIVSRKGETTTLGFDESVIQKMTIGSPVVRPNEHLSSQAVFYLVLTLQIAEDMAAPLG